MIQNSSIRSLIKKYSENKLSHVFLIETNDKQKVLEDVLEFVKEINCTENNFNSECTRCNLCHLTDTLALPSLKIIYPDGQAIKKNQMEELKNYFLSIPYLTKYNIYILNDAEKLNASSANTMLKFIEEPEKNILGFLITNNKENIIHTIKSRCEVIKAYYENNNNLLNHQNIWDLTIKYLYNLEVEKELSIVYNKIILDEQLEKEDLQQLFQYILNVYLDCLNQKEIPEKLKSLNHYSHQELLKRINLVNETIERLNYNININLLLDYFVLSLED